MAHHSPYAAVATLLLLLLLLLERVLGVAAKALGAGCRKEALAGPPGGIPLQGRENLLIAPQLRRDAQQQQPHPSR